MNNKIEIKGIGFEDMQEFMKTFIQEHPEAKNQIQLQSFKPKDSNGVELKANQNIKQLSTEEFFKIDENKTFRDLQGIEVDFDRNDENVYEDLEIV